MTVLALALFVVWMVEAPVAFWITFSNLRTARQLLRAAKHDETVTAQELMIARRSVGREAMRFAVEVLFTLLGVLVLLVLFEVIPPTGGAATALALVAARTLIIVNSYSDRNLRLEMLKRRLGNGDN